MNPVIIIPVFNHAGTVAQVIANVRDTLAGANENRAIIVVNDGSRDATGSVLATIPDVTVLTHARNRGKGAALHTGFAHAAAAGFTHAFTLDADGQHDPRDLLKILAAAREHPADLIMGERDMTGAEVPARSRKGRDAARFWLRVQTGLDIPDSQCGLRAYPLAATLRLPQRFRRYDFETEILARLAWAGIVIRGVPVRCIYFAKQQRVSHFRPIIDTLRGVRVNVFLVTRRLLPLPFEHLGAAPRDGGRVRFGRWWRWSTWRNAIGESLRAGNTNAELAMAFAMGIFVGLTPFYMLQTVLAIYFARRLHLNILAAVVGSQVSIPPLMPIWATLSYAVGHLLLTGQWVFADVHPFSGQWSWSFADLSSKIAPLVLGTIPVGLAASLLGLFTARVLLYFLRSERRRSEFT